jgi:hypothetical protein
LRTLPGIRCVLSLVVSVLAIAATIVQGAQEKGRELRGGWYRWDPKIASHLIRRSLLKKAKDEAQTSKTAQSTAPQQ